MATKHTVCETGYIVEIIKDYTRNLSWTYANPNGTGIDLTGKSIEFELIFEDVTYTYTETPNSYGSAVTITDSVNGEFTIKISDEETSTFEVASGKWALILVTGGDRELIYTDVAEVIKL